MKHKYLVLIGLFALGLFAFNNDFHPESVEEIMDDAEYPSVDYVFTSDTLSDTELDTLTYPYALLSKWTYNYVLSVIRDSGSGNPIFIVQESNQRTGDVWYEVARDTITATGTYRLNGDLIYGMRQRVILDGEGTAEHRYTLTFTGKREY